MEALNTFNGSTGFLDLYILVLITGSVLSVDRKMLIKSFAGFIPTILAGIAGALGLAGLVRCHHWRRAQSRRSPPMQFQSWAVAMVPVSHR